MLEIPWTAILGVVGIILTGVISSAVTLMLQRRKQPTEEAPSIALLSKQLIELALTHAKTIQEQALQQVEQIRQSGLKDETIARLIADRDGLPIRVAELTARSLLDANYIAALQKKLETTGTPTAEQPVRAVDEQLTPLTPPDLLSKLAGDKALREATVPPTPPRKSEDAPTSESGSPSLAETAITAVTAAQNEVKQDSLDEGKSA